MNIKLQQFTGPLDLLLGLIAKKKLGLNEIALSEVTEQFVKYVENLEEEKPEEVADFLVIASKLLWLKARALVPQYDVPEEEEESLIDQLRLYQRFMAVSRTIHALWLDKQRILFRNEPHQHSDRFVPPTNVTMISLRQSLRSLIERLKPLSALPQATIDATISLKQKIQAIRAYLKSQARISFFRLVSEDNQTDTIIGFLAILELMKQGRIKLCQEKTFSEIMVERI